MSNKRIFFSRNDVVCYCILKNGVLYLNKQTFSCFTKSDATQGGDPLPMEKEKNPTRGRFSAPASSQESEEASQLQGLIRQTVAGTLQAMEEEKAQSAGSVRQVDLVGLFLCILEKGWCLLLAGVLVAAVFGWQAIRTLPTYTATAKLYVLGSERESVTMADLQLGAALAQDYQAVFQTWEVYESVCQTLQLPYGYEQARSMLSVTSPEDTRLLYISVTAPNATLAANMANAYASAAKAFIQDTMKAAPPGDFSPARVPQIAQKTSVGLSVVLGFLLGAVVVAFAMTVLFVLDDSPRTPEDIRRDTGMTTLAVLPEEKPGDKVAASVLADGIHALAAGLTFRRGTVLITGSHAGSGKTYVSEQLLETLAAMGRKVVLVDGNLRSGGNRKTVGLSDFLAGRCQGKDILLPTEQPNAWRIPAGRMTADPIRLLDSERLERMLQELTERFDVVLLEAPPAGILADATTLAKHCDAAILVTGYRQGKLPELRGSSDTLRRVGCDVLGTVLNRVPLNTLSNRLYYYRSLRASGTSQRKGRRT